MQAILAEEPNILTILTAVVSFIAILVTLISALTSTRQSAFNNLQAVVVQLEKSMELHQKTIASQQVTIAELELAMRKEKRRSMQYEDYQHALILQLRNADVIPVDIKIYVFDEKPQDLPGE